MSFLPMIRRDQDNMYHVVLIDWTGGIEFVSTKKFFCLEDVRAEYVRLVMPSHNDNDN